MSIVDIVNEEIEIFEGYKDVDGLTKLADDIIDFYSQYNWQTAENIFKDDEVNSRNVRFFQNSAHLQTIIDFMNGNSSKYGTDIYTFINRIDIIVEFAQDFNAGGRYFKHNNNIVIQINLRIKIFQDYLTEHLNVTNKQFGKDDFEKILKDAMIFGMRKTIVHELQHAYDDYRSKGNFDKDPLSKKYYDDVRNDRVNRFADGGEDLTTYYNLPHEYWARFSDTLSRIDTNQDFNSMLNDFKQTFSGYDVLSVDAKKRILNSLYKYYHNKDKN